MHTTASLFTLFTLTFYLKYNLNLDLCLVELLQVYDIRKKKINVDLLYSNVGFRNRFGFEKTYYKTARTDRDNHGYHRWIS